MSDSPDEASSKRNSNWESFNGSHEANEIVRLLLALYFESSNQPHRPTPGASLDGSPVVACSPGMPPGIRLRLVPRGLGPGPVRKVRGGRDGSIDCSAGSQEVSTSAVGKTVGERCENRLNVPPRRALHRGCGNDRARARFAESFAERSGVRPANAEFLRQPSGEGTPRRATTRAGEGQATPLGQSCSRASGPMKRTVDSGRSRITAPAIGPGAGRAIFVAGRRRRRGYLGPGGFEPPTDRL
jgi:hypothetical protein